MVKEADISREAEALQAKAMALRAELALLIPKVQGSHDGIQLANLPDIAGLKDPAALKAVIAQLAWIKNDAVSKDAGTENTSFIGLLVKAARHVCLKHFGKKHIVSCADKNPDIPEEELGTLAVSNNFIKNNKLTRNRAPS